jgi:hypothetical protein
MMDTTTSSSMSVKAVPNRAGRSATVRFGMRRNICGASHKRILPKSSAGKSGAAGFESETTAWRFSPLPPHRAVFIRASRLLAGATGAQFGRSREGLTVRKYQEAKSCTRSIPSCQLSAATSETGLARTSIGDPLYSQLAHCGHAHLITRGGSWFVKTGLRGKDSVLITHKALSKASVPARTSNTRYLPSGDHAGMVQPGSFANW